jgi:hypothetical protein
VKLFNQKKGVKQWFELVENKMEGFHLYAVLRKPKPDGKKPPATPVQPDTAAS